LGLLTGVSLGLRTASDDTGSKIGARLISSLGAGYFRNPWSVVLGLESATTFATHVTHSEAVRDLFRDRYLDGQGEGDGPKDGWYALGSHEFRTQLAGGLRLSEAFAMFVNLGWVFERHLGVVNVNAPISALPFVIGLGGEFRW
jgi:hypothetical protein